MITLIKLILKRSTVGIWSWSKLIIGLKYHVHFILLPRKLVMQPVCLYRSKMIGKMQFPGKKNVCEK